MNRGVKALSERYRIESPTGSWRLGAIWLAPTNFGRNELNKLLREPDVRAIIPGHGGAVLPRRGDG